MIETDDKLAQDYFSSHKSMYKSQASSFVVQNIVVICLYAISSVFFIYYAADWLRKEDLGFDGLLMMFFYFQLYVHWAQLTISPFSKFQARFIALHELLFHHQNTDELNQSNILETHRLDPKCPDNLRAWMIMRIHMIEDGKYNLKIHRAIEQMNRAIFVCLVLIAYFVGKYFIYKKLKVNAMMWLSLCFLVMICIPVIYSLNSAVDTAHLIDQGCKAKLRMLKF